jgi:hypothetical protein
MAAEASRAPVAVREQPIAPADIERPAPIINSVTGALDSVTCATERLRVLYASALGELHELSVNFPDDGAANPRQFGHRLYEAWLIFETAGGLLAQLDRDIAAITEKAYAERRAVAA